MNNLSNILKNERVQFNDELMDMVHRRPVLFEHARSIFGNFTGKWLHLKTHINTPTGITTKPKIPGHNQSIAFKINPANIKSIIDTPNTIYIACIFCIFDFDTPPTPDDDVISVIFVGLDSNLRPTGKDAEEKWPTLYTVADGQSIVADRILKPVPIGANPNNFTKANSLIKNFEDKWGELLTDINNPIPRSRPIILLDTHPMAFVFDSNKLNPILEANDLHAIAGLFGYTEDITSKTPGLFTPCFLGINSSNKAVSDIIFTDTETKFPYSDHSSILATMLTK